MYVTPKSPKGWHKTRFCCFASKIQLLSKKVCYRVSLCETSSGRIVATSFLYLTIHIRFAGDVPIYLKFALKVTHPFRKRHFDRLHLIVPQSCIELAKKVQLSLTGSRQCAFHRAIDEPCALPLSPPKGGTKREFLHLALTFISSLQVIVDTSNLVCVLNIASPSYTDNRYNHLQDWFKAYERDVCTRLCVCIEYDVVFIFYTVCRA